MFEGWDEFYLLVGGAAGALIGLLFVVVTLTTNIDRGRASRGASLYMTPTVFHLAAVLAVGAVSLAPRTPPLIQLAVIGAIGLWGLVYALWAAVGINRFRAPETPHWTDGFCYGLIPAGLYGVLLGAVAGRSALVVGAAMLALLAMAIRNAWDLVTWLAPMKEVPPAQAAPSAPPTSPMPGPSSSSTVARD